MNVNGLELLVLGFAIGGFGTLIGAGGGFILIPILLLLFPDMQPNVVTSISLSIVFLNACSGSFAYARLKRIDYRSAITFGLATLPGSVLGAILTGFIPRRTFDIILGCVLILVAVFLFINPDEGAYKSKNINKINAYRDFIDRDGNRYEYCFNIKTGIFISFFVGFISSFLGIGGGIFHVPALISLLDFPAHVATATSHFVLAIMALSGTIVHLINGTLLQGIKTTMYIGFGVIAGAQVGAHFSNKVKPKGIVKALAVALIVVGLRLLF
jgi:uncharacterized membrane protein YfcA